MQLNILSKETGIGASGDKQDSKCISKWDSGIKETASLEAIFDYTLLLVHL